MTQEDKDLLIKDLCSRLPYGVKVNHVADMGIAPETLIGIAKDMITLQNSAGYGTDDIDLYKPYLFPRSSMTEEQKHEYNTLRREVPVCHYEYGDMVEEVELHDTIESIDYLYKNHIDVRDLIPIGLAIDATGLNIY